LPGVYFSAPTTSRFQSRRASTPAFQLHP
jgi:hypothetical protein